MVLVDPHYLILGYGRVGSQLAAILLERGARVSFLDPYAKTDFKHPNFKLYSLAGTTIEDFEKVGFLRKSAGHNYCCGIVFCQRFSFVWVRKVRFSN